MHRWYLQIISIISWSHLRKKGEKGWQKSLIPILNKPTNNSHCTVVQRCNRNKVEVLRFSKMYEHNKDASSVFANHYHHQSKPLKEKKGEQRHSFEMFWTNGVNYLSECLIQFQVKMPSHSDLFQRISFGIIFEIIFKNFKMSKCPIKVFYGIFMIFLVFQLLIRFVNFSNLGPFLDDSCKWQFLCFAN